MAKSTGFALTAGGVAFTNEWLHSGSPNFRIVMGTLGSALLLSGIEQVNQQLGRGLGIILLITALLTPIDGESPVETLNDLLAGKTPGDIQLPSSPNPKTKPAPTGPGQPGKTREI